MYLEQSFALDGFQDFQLMQTLADEVGIESLSSVSFWFCLGHSMVASFMKVGDRASSNSQVKHRVRFCTYVKVTDVRSALPAHIASGACC